VARAALAATPMIGLELGGHRVVLVAAENGVFALADRCPHRGAPLSQGGEVVTPLLDVDGRLTPGPLRSHVRCPWHKWEFELASGRCPVDPKLRVRTYHAWVDGDEVVVSLDAPAEQAV
jgi:nitrite reductase/ring-hydroxylating ferredoxin subunit